MEILFIIAWALLLIIANCFLLCVGIAALDSVLLDDMLQQAFKNWVAKKLNKGE